LNGGEVGWREGQVFLKFRPGLLTAEEVEALRQAEAELSQLLRPKEESESYPFQWSGEQLGPEVGLDCETTLIEGFELPKLVLVSVSDGQKTFILKPEQLEQFLQLHRDRSFVCHHAAFDFRVVEKFLPDSKLWWSIAESGRLHDTMVLDQLIGLAKTNCFRPEKLVRCKSLEQINSRAYFRKRRFSTKYRQFMTLVRMWPAFAVNPQWRDPRPRECVSAMGPESSEVFRVFLPLVGS
jgi:hypothetical protein